MSVYRTIGPLVSLYDTVSLSQISYQAVLYFAQSDSILLKTSLFATGAFQVSET